MASTLILCDFACHGIESCSSDITLQWAHVIEFFQLNHKEQQACNISYTLRCITKNCQEKCESHLVLSPFEYRTAVICQALIPTLNAFQIFLGNKFVNMDRGICVADNAIATISLMKRCLRFLLSFQKC